MFDRLIGVDGESAANKTTALNHLPSIAPDHGRRDEHPKWCFEEFSRAILIQWFVSKGS